MAFNKTFNQEEVARLKKLIQEGDQVDLVVEKIGTLSNKVGTKRKH